MPGLGENLFLFLSPNAAYIGGECKKVRRKKKEREEGLAYFLYGCRLAGGVLYRMFVTASSADRNLGKSILGSGGGLTLCDVL